MKYLIFFLFLLSACKQQIPDDVLPPAKMNPVLWDVLLADEISAQIGLTDSAFNKLAKHAEYYQAIFRIHKTDEETFKRSIRFYMGHPALFKPVLDSLQSHEVTRRAGGSLLTSILRVPCVLCGASATPFAYSDGSLALTRSRNCHRESPARPTSSRPTAW